MEDQIIQQSGGKRHQRTKLCSDAGPLFTVWPSQEWGYLVLVNRGQLGASSRVRYWTPHKTSLWVLELLIEKNKKKVIDVFSSGLWSMKSWLPSTFHFKPSVGFELFILSRHYFFDQKKKTAQRQANFAKQNKP